MAGGARGDGRKPPLATAHERRDLFRRLFDTAVMLEVFRRELPAASDAPLRVLDCSVKPAKTVSSRKAIQDGRTQLVYRLTIELADGAAREIVLLGMAPVDAGFPGPELEERCRNLRNHPAAAPFRDLALRLEAMQLGLLFFPVDPAMPALAELTGAGAARLFAPHLPECRAGARIERCDYELRHYKPCERAVLRVRATFAPASNAPAPRTVFAKLFAGEQGAASHRELSALWAAAKGSSWLRVPEPLGYDAERRMLMLGEVAGGRDLSTWIHCVEHGLPLPAGVDLERLERCVLAAAQALAALQRCGVRPGARRTFQDALDSLRKDRDLLVQGDAADPGLVARAVALVQRLESSTPRAETLVPSHGGARHKQTIGDERSLTFVDWDGFCLANPALDAATFLARLRLEPITNPGSAPELERIAESFRRGFLELAPEAAPDLALHEGLVLTEQVLRSFRRTARDAEMPGAIARLASAAEERLDRGDREACGRPRASPDAGGAA